MHTLTAENLVLPRGKIDFTTPAAMTCAGNPDYLPPWNIYHPSGKDPSPGTPGHLEPNPQSTGSKRVGPALCIPAAPAASLFQELTRNLPFCRLLPGP
jgi:hypothetical protein